MSMVDQTEARQPFALSPIRRAAAAGALLGGLAWTVKSAGILLSGDQPVAFFELAPVPFALAALAFALLSGRRAALVLSAFAAAACVFYSTSYLLGMDSAAFGLALLVGMLALHAALVLAGVPLARTGALGAWSSAPLLIGVSAIPLVVLGGALAELNERLLELPLLLLGLAWMALGAGVLGGPRLALPRGWWPRRRPEAA